MSEQPAAEYNLDQTLILPDPFSLSLLSSTCLGLVKTPSKVKLLLAIRRKYVYFRYCQRLEAKLPKSVSKNRSLKSTSKRKRLPPGQTRKIANRKFESESSYLPILCVWVENGKVLYLCYMYFI